MLFEKIQIPGVSGWLQARQCRHVRDAVVVKDTADSVWSIPDNADTSVMLLAPSIQLCQVGQAG